MIKIIIDRKQQNRPLGNFLKNELKLPTSLIHKLLRKNKIKINGQKPDLNWRLEPGFEVKIFADLEKKNERIIHVARQFYKKHLHIIFEDANLLVINKQADISMQPSKKIDFSKTLIGVVDYYGQQKGFKPYLVHRLDKNTSGVLLIAKNSSTKTQLDELFFHKKIKKTYLALAKGIISKNQTITTPVLDNLGKKVSAISTIKIMQTWPQATLIQVFPKTGRFHQIRQHLQSINHPIIGDDRYGDFNLNRIFRQKYGLKRHFLHAEQIEFSFEQRIHHWLAPLPADLTSVLKKLS